LLHLVVSSIFEELPDYAVGRSHGELDDIRAGVQQSICLCLRLVREKRRLDEGERTKLRLTGGQRARQGISKQAVTASVKIAIRVGRGFLMTCTDVCEDADVVMAAFREITQVLDWFEDDAAQLLGEGHDDAYARITATEDRGQALLVDRLLARRFHDVEEVLRHVADVGLSTSREAFVVVAAGFGTVDERHISATVSVLRRSTMLAQGPLRLGEWPHVPIVAQPKDASEWATFVGVLAAVGSSARMTFVYEQRPVPLLDVATAYWPIVYALPCLRAAATAPGAIPSVVLRFYRVLSTGTADECHGLVDEVFGAVFALPERERSELFEVLDCLYECGWSSSTMARHLNVHRNTVGNRVRCIRELTGLDIRNPPQRLVLEMLSRIRRVGAPRDPA
jgi:hypothetical protein